MVGERKLVGEVAHFFDRISVAVIKLSANLKEGETIRLKHAYNVRVVKKDAMQIFAEFVSASKIDAPLIPWLIEEQSIGIEVLMPDAKIIYGSAEAEMLNYEVGSILQLERLGYARLDAREGNTAKFWFAHK